MIDDDLEDTYVPIEECAGHLGLSVPEVEDLVAKGLLKARRHGGWLLEVQPALIPGVTTSIGVRGRSGSAGKNVPAASFEAVSKKTPKRARARK
jgi:hypothetical protein